MSSKVYCAACQKLVKGREEKLNAGHRVTCSKCSKLLRVWTGIAWKTIHSSL